MLSRVYFVSISGTIISEIRDAREINVSEEYKNVSSLVKKKKKNRINRRIYSQAIFLETNRFTFSKI